MRSGSLADCITIHTRVKCKYCQTLNSNHAWPCLIFATSTCSPMLFPSFPYLAGIIFEWFLNFSGPCLSEEIGKYRGSTAKNYQQRPTIGCWEVLMGVFCPRIVPQMPPRLPNWGLTTSGWAAGTVIDAMMHCECARFSNDFGFFPLARWIHSSVGRWFGVSLLLFGDACDCHLKSPPYKATSLGLLHADSYCRRLYGHPGILNFWLHSLEGLEGMARNGHRKVVESGNWQSEVQCFIGVAITSK